jgi:hypothetical protein
VATTAGLLVCSNVFNVMQEAITALESRHLVVLIISSSLGNRGIEQFNNDDQMTK